MVATQRPSNRPFAGLAPGAIGDAARCTRMPPTRRAGPPERQRRDRGGAWRPYVGHVNERFLVWLVYALDHDHQVRLGGKAAPVTLPYLLCLHQQLELVEPAEFGKSIPVFVNWNKRGKGGAPRRFGAGDGRIRSA